MASAALTLPDVTYGLFNGYVGTMSEDMELVGVDMEGIMVRYDPQYRDGLLGPSVESSRF